MKRQLAGYACVLMTAAMNVHAVTHQHTATHNAPELYHTPGEKRSIQNIDLNGIHVGALLEIEAAYREQGEERSSDLTLATLELGIEAEATDSLSAKALLLWEEDVTDPIEIDEALITLRDLGIDSLYFAAGRMYVPFGQFRTHFISDPLVQTFAETRQTAILIGYSKERLELSVSLFRGRPNSSDERSIDGSAASLTLKPVPQMEVGLSWLSDIADSPVIAELTGSPDTQAEIPRTPAAGAYISVNSGRFTIDAEYVTVLEEFEAGLLRETAARPDVWNLELAAMLRDGLEISAKAEGTSSLAALPKHQSGAAISVSISDKSALSLEMLSADYGGDTPDSFAITARLAVEL